MKSQTDRKCKICGMMRDVEEEIGLQWLCLECQNPTAYFGPGWY